MTFRVADHVPEDLGFVGEVDPFDIQPGAILFERLCIIGQVRHSTNSWRVEVTDLGRKFGTPPHHRLLLHMLPSIERTERALRSALSAHTTHSGRIDAVITTTEGLCLLVPYRGGRPLRLPLSTDEAFTMARTLAQLLTQLHHVGLAGIRFDLRDIRIDCTGALQFASMNHLSRIHAAEPNDAAQTADVRALMTILASLDEPSVSERLSEVASNAQAIAERLNELEDGYTTASPADVLPAAPPFVGRDLPLRKIQEAGARTRHTGVEVFAVAGEQGMGRSRLLEQLTLELTRGYCHTVIHTRLRPAAPSAGLSVLLAEIVGAIQRTYGSERDALVARIQRTVGSSLGLLAEASPELVELVGRHDARPPDTLDQRQTRIGATVADLICALASPERSVALLLDDIEHMDASIEATLYQLTVPTRTDPVLIVFAHRPETRLGLPRPAERLDLSPLPLDALHAMIEGALPGPLDTIAIAARVYATSGGSPEAAWQQIRQWIERGLLARNERGMWVLTDATPGGITDIAGYLSRPWANLGERARSLAALALIRSEPVDPGWLSRVTGWTPSVGREAANELVDAAVLYRDPSRRLNFTSDAAQKTAHDVLSAAEVRAAHGMIARWMRQLGNASASQRSWHEEHAAGEGVDESLAELHIEAGRYHLTQCDANRGLWHFDRAVARTRRPDARAEALDGRADALLLLDRNREALASYLELYDNVDDPVKGLQIAGRVLYSFYLFGDEEACMQVADRALRMSGRPLPAGMGAALVDVALAALHLITGRTVDAAKGDATAMVHVWLVSSLAAHYPHIGLSSLFRALAAANRRTSAATAWARAYFSVVLASAGLVSWMERLLDRAEADARYVEDAKALGLVLYLRGQNELTLGCYDRGQDNLDRAIRAYRSAGDLSMSALALALAAQFAMDHEPLPALERRIHDALAASWRYRHRSLLPLLYGMQMLVLARRGELRPDALDPAFAFVDEPAKSLFDISGLAYAAMALQRAGAGQRALEVSRRAYESYLACAAPVPFLIVALIAHADAVITYGEDPAEAQRLTSQLRKRARSVAFARNAHKLVRAKLAVTRSGTVEAAQILADIINTAGQHQQRWFVHDAHMLMAQLHAGSATESAKNHRIFAAELAQELGIVRKAAQPDQPVVPLEESAASCDVPLWSLIDELRPVLQQSLPPDVELDVGVAAGIRAIGIPDQIELLAINLVLTVRDAVGAPARLDIAIDEQELLAEEAAQAPQARPGRWSRICVGVESQALGFGRGALAECRELCTRCNGFLEVGTGAEGLFLRANLPAPRREPNPQRVGRRRDRPQRRSGQGDPARQHPAAGVERGDRSGGRAPSRRCRRRVRGDGGRPADRGRGRGDPRSAPHERGRAGARAPDPLPRRGHRADPRRDQPLGGSLGTEAGAGIAQRSSAAANVSPPPCV